MVVGWMVIVKAIAEYATARRTEKTINTHPIEEREAAIEFPI
jgi:hypothetical protein